MPPFLFLLLLLAALPAVAQDLPRCVPEIAGAVTCMAGRSCECAFRRGGLMTGEPDGWRWDCGILRGNCGDPHGQWAPDYGGLPPGFSYDNSDNSIHLDQTTGINGSGRQNIQRPRARPDQQGRDQPAGPPRRLFVEPRYEEDVELPY